MTRAQVAVLVAILIAIGGGAWLLGQNFPRRGHGAGDSVDARRAEESSGDKNRGQRGHRFALAVRGPDGSLLNTSSQRRVGLGDVDAGAHVIPLHASSGNAWVGAPGCTWTRIEMPPVGTTLEVKLLAAAPPLVVRVTEADGTPAADVPVVLQGGAVGPPESLVRRTEAAGTVTIDDRPSGVVRLKVGGTERAGPTIRAVMGRDREVTATLEPPWQVAGRVIDAESKAPIAGADVVGVSGEGPCGHAAKSAADGSFLWKGRMTEDLSLVVRAQGHETTTIEPPLPDPRGQALSSVTVLLASAKASAVGEVVAPPGSVGGWELTVEPSVLAVMRDWFGPEAAPFVPERRSSATGGPFEFRGVPSDVPLRVSLRGDVAPEDHLLAAGSPRLAALRLTPLPAERPEFAAGTPPSTPPDAHAPRGYAVLKGRVTDSAGNPLSGLTVAGDGAKATTGTDGSFALEGLRTGEALDLGVAWLDGADCGAADPSTFTPYLDVATRAGVNAISITYPKVASATLRIVDGLDDRPMSWARVVIEDRDGRVRYDATAVTREGRATLSGLPPTTAGRMTVLAPGLRGIAGVVLDAGKTVDLGDVRLSPGGTVAGRVVAKDGSPVAGATVALVEDGWIRALPRRVAVEREYALRRTTTGADGAFALSGLDPGRREALAAWADGYAPTAALVVWAGGVGTSAERLTITLSKGGYLRARIAEKGGAALPGASVDLTSAKNGTRWLDLVRRAVVGGSAGSSEDVRRASRFLLSESLDVPGTYAVGPVEPGAYEVTVDRPGYSPVHSRWTIPGDVPSEAAFAKPILEGKEWALEMQPR